ncbi:MAG: D-alanyl-D-alanine carboxypeptidase, partial [Actinomycetota bacterium]|nr:D-alanyl-D-alanine carboxypeptidase [Actinomycetota bacterium]
MIAAAVAAGAGRAGAPVPVRARAPLPPRPPLTCSACLVMVDDDVLWGREIDTRRANASTTKMATAVLVVREAELDEPVTASRTAAATGGGGLDLRPGDVFTVEELLHALLLSSSNDAAVALAEHVAGSEAAFVARMNAFAETLGLRGSRFVTSHGLDVPGHYSTARDLARLALAVLRRPALAEIVATPETTIGGTSGTHRLVNTNPLLESYDGAVGVKTGYTSGAGDVLVAAAVRAGRRLVAVAMGSDDAPADARALLDYGFRILGRGVLVREGRILGALVFDPSGAAAVVAGRTVRGIPEPGSVGIRFDPARNVTPPLAAGETVGTVVVSSAQGNVVARAPAVAD